jgi:hypothetical protein
MKKSHCVKKEQFSFYPVKYASYQKIFQIKVVDLNEFYVLCHVRMFATSGGFFEEFLKFDLRLT